MALSGSQITRIGVLGSPGRAYAGFTAKSEGIAAPNITVGLSSVIAGTVALSSSISSTVGHNSGIISDGKGLSSALSTHGAGLGSRL